MEMMETERKPNNTTAIYVQNIRTRSVNILRCFRRKLQAPFYSVSQKISLI